jgi:hypothetical protein
VELDGDGLNATAKITRFLSRAEALALSPELTKVRLGPQSARALKPVGDRLLRATPFKEPVASGCRASSEPSGGSLKSKGRVSGEYGYVATYRVVCRLREKFELANDEIFLLVVANYNPRCRPPGTEAELRHKVYGEPVGHFTQRTTGAPKLVYDPVYLVEQATPLAHVTDTEFVDWLEVRSQFSCHNRSPAGVIHKLHRQDESAIILTPLFEGRLCIHPRRARTVEWKGSAVDLESRLLTPSSNVVHQARTLLSWQGASGTYLGRLRNQCPERISYHRTSSDRVWTIESPQ